MLKSTKMRFAAALALWSALALAVVYSPPAASAGAPPGAVPGAVQHDPGEWFVDANALFRYSVASLHQSQKSMTTAQASDLRSRCLTVATEYNKRAASIKPNRVQPAKLGKDEEGGYSNGFRPTEGFFEKRGLPRRLDGSECVLT